MPKVKKNGKVVHYPYTKKGIEAAKKAQMDAPSGKGKKK